MVDSRIDDSRRRPDLVAYKTVNGEAQRGPDYAHAVFEVKLGDRIADDAKAVFREKRSYVQTGTRWFYLIDQRVVVRVDCADRALIEAVLTGHGRTFPDVWT